MDDTAARDRSMAAKRLAGTDIFRANSRYPFTIAP